MVEFPQRPVPKGFTLRLFRLLLLWASGWTEQEIATELGMSEHSVHHAIHNEIYVELNVNSRAEALQKAWRLGVVRPEDFKGIPDRWRPRKPRGK